MSLFALLAMLLLGASLPIADEVYTVPRSEWRYVPIVLKQRAGILNGQFEVLSGGSGVRVALVSAADLERMESGQSHRPLLATGYQRSGQFRHALPQPGTYAVVIDNRLEGRGPAKVHLLLAVDFGGRPEPKVGYVPPHRRVAVIAIGLVLFFSIVGLAAHRLSKVW